MKDTIEIGEKYIIGPPPPESNMLGKQSIIIITKDFKDLYLYENDIVYILDTFSDGIFTWVHIKLTRNDTTSFKRIVNIKSADSLDFSVGSVPYECDVLLSSFVHSSFLPVTMGPKICQKCGAKTNHEGWEFNEYNKRCYLVQ